MSIKSIYIIISRGEWIVCVNGAEVARYRSEPEAMQKAAELRRQWLALPECETEAEQQLWTTGFDLAGR